MIKIKNAYENNLKNISVEIPINKLTTIIGVSGSGKSSLIYGVLAKEAQRKEKIDSGNANCLDYAVRPKFSEIENLPYCVTLKQRGLGESISSTLATVSKLHELLRNEIAKYGDIVGDKGNNITEPTISDIKKFIQTYYPKDSVEFFAIICDEKYTDGKKELYLLKANNIKEAIFISSYDNKERLKKLSTVNSLNSNYYHTILVPVNYLTELEKYKKLAQENFRIRIKSNNLDLKLNTDYLDIHTGKIYQKKSSQLLSFNASSKHSGKCDKCNGHGIIEDIDLETLISKDKNLNEDFLNLEINANGCYKYVLICRDTIKKSLKQAKIDANKTFFDLSIKKQQVIKDIVYPKIVKHKGKPAIGKFIKSIKCSECNGTRLNYKANAVKLYGLNISEMLLKTVDDLYRFLSEKTLHHKKILSILESLKQATLGYLTLDRTTDTLSGGELQRLKFSLELNSEYKNLLYILDEPSVGLHSYNNHQMIGLIKDLRDKGNTVIISEHNHDYIENSDYIIELGYGSGKNGGEVIFKGETKEFENNQFSRDKINIDYQNAIKLIGVTSNNIKNENFNIPLNCLVSISGVSGSGKSSLIHKVLVPTIKQYIADKSINNSLIKEIKNIEKIKAIVELTQSQIGTNSRSIVATYLNIFDNIRDIFASLEISKEFGFNKGYYSFNSNSGACETCKGLGEIENMICPSCLGQRYKHEILDIRYKDLNIIEILDNPVSELLKIFDDKKLQFAFEILQKLGLSHISLGRTTPTLSGGEAQRLKLAEVLIASYNKIQKGNFLFVLDEPTTGLNAKDTAKIYAIFDEILSFNNSIILIEHNLEIIKNSDFIIDLGIGSGKEGGKNIFEGKYENLLKHATSLTAKALNGKHEKLDGNKVNQSNLKEKLYNNRQPPNCNRFYLTDKHFTVEKDFAANYEVVTDNPNHKYFTTKKALFTFVRALEKHEISFNPYVTELFKYKIVPNSLKKAKLTHLKKIGFKIGVKDFELDEWNYRIKIGDIEKAYNFGNGWITVTTKNHKYELFTRLVSLKNKIIGTPEINEHTFNLYLNGCIYCAEDIKGEGVGKIQVYNQNLIIKDQNKSILETGFLRFPIKLQLKSVISKFAQEGLFDFTKPFNKLNDDEQNIFLFGFKEYKFLKPKGKATTLGDYIQWQGLYKYIYDNLKKIYIEQEIRNSEESKNCPFCWSGFKKEVEFYLLDNKSIVEYL